eukprot:TRINITY_DN5253_c1_g1_i1.p1 TRINITY_DN5253_c1_g1~~TRINITY_DN5253_c1_g1_i1.p1  ORF type:complete len:298 (-),score=72.88 TRINITY_DN5253_c1_g1_i1:22-915(-)
MTSKFDMNINSPNPNPSVFVSGLVTQIVKMEMEVLTLPLRKMKILAQSQPVSLRHVPDSPSSVGLRETIKRQGVSALFAGFLPTVVKVVPSFAVSFLVTRNVKNILRISPLKAAIPGWKWISVVADDSVIKAITMMVTYPLDLARTCMQANPTSKHEDALGFVDVLKQIDSLNGFSGLFAGFTVSLAHQVIYSAILNGIKAAVSVNTGPLEILIALGVIMTSTMICYPLDTVATCMRVESQYTSKQGGWRRPWTIFQDIIQIKGVRGLYAGVGWAFLAIGGTFVTGTLPRILYHSSV